MLHEIQPRIPLFKAVLDDTNLKVRKQQIGVEMQQGRKRRRGGEDDRGENDEKSKSRKATEREKKAEEKHPITQLEKRITLFENRF